MMSNLFTVIGLVRDLFLPAKTAVPVASSSESKSSWFKRRKKAAELPQSSIKLTLTLFDLVTKCRRSLVVYPTTINVTQDIVVHYSKDDIVLGVTHSRAYFGLSPSDANCAKDVRELFATAEKVANGQDLCCHVNIVTEIGSFDSQYRNVEYLGETTYRGFPLMVWCYAASLEDIRIPKNTSWSKPIYAFPDLILSRSKSHADKGYKP